MFVSTTIPPGGSEIVVHLVGGGDTTSVFDWLVGVGPALVAIEAIVVGYLQVRRSHSSQADLEQWKWTIQQRREFYIRFLAKADQTGNTVHDYFNPSLQGEEAIDAHCVEAFHLLNEVDVLRDEAQLVASEEFVAVSF